MLTFLKKRKKNPGKKLRSLLGKFELPSFNATVMKVLSQLRDPDSSIKEIAGQVQIDPGMHVKTLRTVNKSLNTSKKAIKKLLLPRLKRRSGKHISINNKTKGDQS